MSALSDQNAVLQVIGNLIKNPVILADSKHILTEKDFDLPLPRTIYIAIRNLFSNYRAETISIIDIDNYLQTNEGIYNNFKKQNGLQYLKDAETASNPSNFEYYYNRVKKLSALRALKNDGFDISKIYDEDETDYEKNRRQLEQFDKMTIAQIFDIFTEKVNDLECDYICRGDSEEGFISDGAKDLFERLQANPEIGTPLQGDIYNTLVRGARLKKYYLISGASGTGKALINGSKVLTENGYKNIENIKIGDNIFGEDGKLYKAIGVYPQGKKQVYEIEFSDGSIVKCCNEHLWNIQTKDMRAKKSKHWRTHTLQEIIDNYKLYDEKTGKWNLFIPMTQPIEFEEKKLPIKPYLLGALLGDGYIREKGSMSFANEDEDVLRRVNSELKDINAKLSHQEGVAYNIIIGSGYGYNQLEGKLRIELRKLGLLGHTAKDKFIPEIYKYSSVNDRLELLKGLIDTDGYCAGSYYDFSSNSKQLVDDMKFICETLGLTAHYSEKQAICTNGKNGITDCGITHRLSIKCSELIPKIHYSQKREKQWKKGQTSARRTIRRITKTENFEEMTCIKTSNPTELFLTDNCIVTHNTRQMVGHACTIAFPERYSIERKTWVTTGQAEKILFFCTEMEEEEIQTMVMAHISGVNEDKILNNYYESPDEKQRVYDALKIMDYYKDNFVYVRVGDPSISQIKALIRKNVLKNDVKYVFYDYIFSSPGLLGEYKDLNLREDVILMMASIALKDLANELDVFMMSGTQLNEKWKEYKGIRDYNLIRGSKAIADKIDVGGISLPLTDEEHQMVDKIAREKGLDLPTQVQDMYKIRRGKYTRVRIWSKVDLGTCRTKDLFLTDTSGNPIDLVINEPLFEDEFHSIINSRDLVSERKEKESEEITKLKEKTVEKEISLGDLI